MGEEFFRQMQAQSGGEDIFYPGGARPRGGGVNVYFPGTGAEAAAAGARAPSFDMRAFGGRGGAGGPSGMSLLSSLLSGLGEAGTAVYGGAASLLGKKGKIPFSAIPQSWLGSPRYAAFVRQLIAQGIVEPPRVTDLQQAGVEEFIPPAQEGPPEVAAPGPAREFPKEEPRAEAPPEIRLPEELRTEAQPEQRIKAPEEPQRIEAPVASSGGEGPPSEGARGGEAGAPIEGGASGGGGQEWEPEAPTGGGFYSGGLVPGPGEEEVSGEGESEEAGGPSYTPGPGEDYFTPGEGGGGEEAEASETPESAGGLELTPGEDYETSREDGREEKEKDEYEYLPFFLLEDLFPT